MEAVETNKIGSFIAERRKELGLRQADLGEKVSYSVQAISKMEKGLSQPAGALIPALCNALEISLNNFFAMEKPTAKQNAVAPFDGLTFAENIAYLRLKEGLSQYALANAIKVSKRSIANYERGVSVPGFDVVSAYVKHFGVIPSDLYFTTLTPKPSQKPHLGRRIIWSTFGALAVVGISVAATFPLWGAQNELGGNKAFVPDSTSSAVSQSVSSSSASSSVEISSFE
jgi:Predicted transcriptional regulators